MHKFKIVCLLACFFCGVSDAGLMNHLKKAEDKTDSHKMRNIDFIYMINLDQRPEKFAQASGKLHQYGIYPYRFSAVNGWELPIEVFNEVGLQYKPGMTAMLATTYPPEKGGEPVHEFMQLGKTYFYHGLSRGTISIVLSHVSVLKDAYDSGYETIWVLEDDIEIVKDPHLMADLIDRLDTLVGKENWDMLFTDPNYQNANGYVVAFGAVERPDMDCNFRERYSAKYTTNEIISADFKKITARFGAYSMIIRRSGIKKLLDFAIVHQIFLPYDLDNYLAPGLQRYTLRYDVVTNMIISLSDNKECGYKKKKILQ